MLFPRMLSPVTSSRFTWRAELSSQRRRFASGPRGRGKQDHYATLAIPRTATKAQIKTSYYQLSKRYHPDVAKDSTSHTKFHAVSEAYAILGDDRKRREYDRSLGSPFRAPHHTVGQHPQATTTRPSHQAGFKHFWPNHPKHRAHGPMDGPYATRSDHLYEHARGHPQSGPGSQAFYTGPRTDPFSNPFVQRATDHRRSEAAAGKSADTRPHHQHPGYQGRGTTSRTTSGGEERRGSVAGERPTQDEAAAESGVMRALGASGLVGVIILVAAIGGNSRRTS